LLALRKKAPEPEKFMAPGGWLIPALTIFLCFFLLTAATRSHWIAGGIAIGIGLLLYWWSFTTKARRHEEAQK